MIGPCSYLPVRSSKYHIIVGFLTFISYFVFVQYPACPLACNVCYPYPPYTEAMLLGKIKEMIPQRLVDFLQGGSAVSSRTFRVL